MSDWIHEELRCCKCGAWTMVAALGWDAMPIIDEYVGPCCRRYKGTVEFTETDGRDRTGSTPA